MTQSEQLEIIFKDQYFVAVNKPSGLLVHRSPVDKKENWFALQVVRDQIGKYVYPIHRLDKPTSGVLLFALTSEAANKTSVLFKTGQIRKKYIAVVRGYVKEGGTINHPLKEVKDKRIRGWNSETQPKYSAVTGYKSLAKIELPYHVDKYPTSRYSLVKLFPKSGRRHQLRRHMKHISHPIIGDTKYGKDSHNKFFKNHFNCNGLLLAAVELQFRHPVTGTDVTITANFNSEFHSILAKFNWNNLFLAGT